MRMSIARLDDGTTEVDIKLLDDGRTLIHWLYECEDGLIRHVGHSELRGVMGRKAEGSYRLACRPQQATIASQKRGNVRYVCVTSEDLSAVTCAACLATKEAAETRTRTPSELDPRAAQLAMDTFRSLQCQQDS